MIDYTILDQETQKYSGKTPKICKTKEALYYYHILGLGCTSAARKAGVHENSLLK